ncbi:MAG: M23 family metallopeptidase [Muribaculaceae bacterium]|nr:M23 family metallopeptidase [Muribaculaceae bacterium]
MSKKIFYRYNENSEIYERVYPTTKERLVVVARHFIIGILIGVAIFLIVYYWIDFPREKQLKKENNELISQLDILNARMNRSLAIIEDLQQRDDNFYRVMMQAERVSPASRYAGLDNDARYNELRSLNDADLIISVTKKMDRIDQQLYSQIKSYNELIGIAKGQKDRIQHIPSIQPISAKDMKQMASGYGYRRDPVYGISKFHEGLDFAADTGTPIYATGNGKVIEAEWNSGYGNMIDISHGYNYVTRYAHLSKIDVKAGQEVKRGDKIGEVGNTGKSTGSHLHYEVRYKGEAQNPINYYFFDITPEQYAELVKQAENAGHVMD